MKKLLILRHAKASQDNPAQGDHERPLNNRGQQEAPRMGQLIQEKNLVPDLILSSTALRAKLTAEKVAQACGYQNDITLTKNLYLADPQTYVQELKRLPEKLIRVMIVGHNPGMEDFVEILSGQREHLPPAALVEMDLPVKSWKELTPQTKAKLVNLWRPQELEQ